MELFLRSLACGSFWFLGIQLLIRRDDPNRLAGRFLSLSILSAGAMLLDDCLLSFELYAAHPYLLGLTDQLQLVLAPAFYLGVRSYTEIRPRWKKTDALHFLPAALYTLVEMPSLLLPPEEKVKLYLNPPVLITDSWVWLLAMGIWLGLVSAYLFFSVRRLMKHRKQVLIFSSNTDAIDLRWLEWMVVGIVCMLLVWISDVYKWIPAFSSYSGAIYLLGIYYVGYFVWGQARVFPYSEEEKVEMEAVLNTPVIATLQAEERLTDAKSVDLKRQLDDWMDKEKPYLLPGLSLPELARQLHLSTHELSYFLNQGLGQNFYTYVNHYRIEEAKRLLSDRAYSAWTLIAIAFESGFNSKTTFNTTFRQATGISPSEYRKNALTGRSAE